MGDISVQRGRTDVGNTGGTASITAVSALTAAFEFNGNSMFTHGGNISSGGNQEGDDMSGMVELTATDTVTLSRQSGSLSNSMRFDWEVIEYTGSGGGANEFIVRSRNTVTLSGTTGSASLDTTPTNIDKCVPFITGVRTSQTSNNGDELRAVAWIDDSGTLQVRKGSTSNTTVVQIVVVEFTGSAWSVYHGTATSSADTGSITLNTDSDGAGGSTGDVTSWGTAFIVGQFTSTDHGLDSIACRYQPGTGTTSVDWDFNSGNSSSHQHFVHVVRHADMTVTRYTPSGSAANDTNVDITSAGLTDIAEAMIIGTCQGSGGGTAYGRNWRNYRLTSTTNATHYCHRSGNTILHGIQVIDFSGITSGVGPVTLTMEDATLSQSAEAPGLTQASVLTLAEVLQSITADAPALTQKHQLTADDATLAQIAESIDLVQAATLQIDEALQAATAANLALTQANTLTIDAADLSLIADAISLNAAQSLTMDEATLSLQAESPNLTQAHALVVQAVQMASEAEEIGLTQSHTLVIADNLLTVVVNNVELTGSVQLIMQSTQQALSAESPVLNQAHVLVIDDALLSMTGDLISLTAGLQLIVEQAALTLQSANTDLTQANVLLLDEATMQVASDNLTVSNAVVLTLDDADITQVAEQVILTQSHSLAADSTLQALSADEPSLLQDAILAVDETRMQLIADAITLIEGSDARIVYVTVAGRNRQMQMRARNRIFTIN